MPEQRPWNFSAGPATMPEEVLRQAAEEMLDWRGTGMSVMEMSHRSEAFGSIIGQAEQDLRELLVVPPDYAVPFMQGGALAQNAILPLNLGRGGRADYAITGAWSVKSEHEARKYCDVQVACRPESGFVDIPPLPQWRVREDAAYLHYCGNETIDGVEFHEVPGGFAPPLVADMSSTLLSRPLDVAAHGCVYAGAQKNIGPAGLTLVIVRRDLLGYALPACPSAFDYAVVDAHHSMFNTPPTYAIYLAGLVLQWLRRQREGDLQGIEAMAERNRRKAAMLYRCIDSSSLYLNRVAPGVRSRMNIPFQLREPALDAAFLEGARAHGLLQLKGHKSVGGMRASIYNAMPERGVRALVEYMVEFERSH